MSKTAHILAARAEGLPAMETGFYPIGEALALDRLQVAGLWIGPRPLLEQDESFRQIIPYILLRKGDGTYATYTRGASGSEARLHGKLAIGVGGHIDLEDVAANQAGAVNLDVTLQVAAGREVAEEVVMMLDGHDVTHRAGNSVRWMGLLVDNDDAVGRVHIGIVGVINVVDHMEVTANETSQEDIAWLTPKQLRKEKKRLEGWTAILLPNLETLMDPVDPE